MGVYYALLKKWIFFQDSLSIPSTARFSSVLLGKFSFCYPDELVMAKSVLRV
jgi:hypothetical protein